MRMLYVVCLLSFANDVSLVIIDNYYHNLFWWLSEGMARAG